MKGDENYNHGDPGGRSRSHRTLTEPALLLASYTGSGSQLPIHRLMTAGQRPALAGRQAQRGHSAPHPQGDSALHRAQPPHPTRGQCRAAALSPKGSTPHGGLCPHPEGTAPGRGRRTRESERSTRPDGDAAAVGWLSALAETWSVPGPPRLPVGRPLTGSLGHRRRSRRGVGSSGLRGRGGAHGAHAARGLCTHVTVAGPAPGPPARPAAATAGPRPLAWPRPQAAPPLLWRAGSWGAGQGGRRP